MLACYKSKRDKRKAVKEIGWWEEHRISESGFLGQEDYKYKGPEV